MRQLTFDPYIPLALWVPLALAAAGLLAWYARAARRRLSRGRRLAVIALMGLAIAVPLTILLNPTWWEQIPPPAGKPLLTILVDRSASMATRDADRQATRYEIARELAAEMADALAARYKVRIRHFADDSSLIGPERLAEISPDGASTDLAAAIEDALDDDRPQGQAMLLLSDGIHNAGGGMARVRRSVAKAKAMAVPLYVKTFGGATGVRDLQVDLTRPRELAFVDQRVTVVVGLRSRGSLGGRTQLSLTLDGETIETREVELALDQALEETFEVTQPTSGLYRYEIRAEPLPGEVTEVNNHATLLLRVVDEPVRVLLLEGKPYWDTKFLIRTLAADESIELTCVVQLTEGRLLERKIMRTATAADENADENAAAGDAATKNVATKNATEQWTILGDAAQILADPDVLDSYQIVVLGRNAEVFLGDEALVRLEKWLKHRESALVCFRGAPSSQINQRLGALLPVRWTPSRESRFRVQMTEAGKNLRWVSDDAGGQLAGLPSLATVALPERREMAQTLARTVGAMNGAADGDPVITYLRVGMGRVVVVEGAGMWRWAFLPPSHQHRDKTYGTLWRSLTRWLVSHVQLLPSQRMALNVEKVTFATTENATAELLIREEELPQQLPEILLTSTALSKPRTFTPIPSGNSPGQFRVAFGQLPEGTYQVSVKGTGDEEVSTTTAFDVRRGNLREVLSVEAKPEQMAMIARLSGGAVLDTTDADALARQFDRHLSRSRPQRTSRTTAWDRWWVLFGAFAVWGTAWGLRRWSGLI